MRNVLPIAQNHGAKQCGLVPDASMDPTPESADDADDVPPWEQPGAFRRDCEPHRAEMLGTMATASVVCALSGCFTWGISGIVGVGLAVAICILARRDLKEMAAGRTDPAGEVATRLARRRSLRAVLFCVGVWLLVGTVLLPEAIGLHPAQWGYIVAAAMVLGLILLVIAGATV